MMVLAGSLRYVGEYGADWSKTAFLSTTNAYNFNFYLYQFYISPNSNRWFGFAGRTIKPYQRSLLFDGLTLALLKAR